MTIERLDDRTVEQIAAGEVVERPASVVKELVENAVDAGADRVEVAVETGGTEGIRVADDGHGMDERDLRRAVEQHATSKIGDIEDLEAGVDTLGFRGEALHAVGAVSRLTLTSRPPGADRGATLTVEGGDVGSVEPAGCPVGTTVEVEDLFYNVPARRKYLAEPATEFGHVNRVVSGYALAAPDVAVSLSHDGRETFATAGDGDRQAAVMSVYGREVAASMVSVDAGPDLPEGPLNGVTGLVSHPETTRASRDYLSTFVNGRYVTASAVREAAVEAYGTQLASDRYPFVVLDLSVDPATVDVNVHPRKLEVRWMEEESVREQVQTTVENALQEEGLLRSSAPRGRSAPEQAEIEPSSTSEESDDSMRESADEPETTSKSGPRVDDANESTADTVDTQRSSNTEPSRTRPSQPQSADKPTRPSGSFSESTTSDSGSPSASHTHPSASPTTTEPNTQKTLSGEDAHATTEFENFPDLRVLGQLDDTYIVAEAGDGLILIDQHAADERINYERLKTDFEGETTTQALAEPVKVELTAKEAELFQSYQPALARLGFRANQIERRTIEVTTVPSLVAETAGPQVIRDVLADMMTGEQAAEQTVEALADDLLADMACYPSITGNTSLTDGSVVDLLSTLDDCENPWTCPHGRPVLIHIDSEEIDDRFERDYPGH